MTCERCSSEHEGTYGSGRFCSGRCARGWATQDKRKDINLKVSKKMRGQKCTSGRPFVVGFDKRRLQDPETRLIAGQKAAFTRLIGLSNKLWDEVGQNEKRRRLLLIQAGRCLCGIYEWNGAPITLELHHVDGDATRRHPIIEIKRLRKWRSRNTRRT